MLKILIIFALIPLALYGLTIVLSLLGILLSSLFASIGMIFKGNDYGEKGCGCLLLIIIIIIIIIIVAIID